MTMLGDAVRQPPEERVVGSDRVLAILVELAKFPDGASLDAMARAVRSPKPTVHRALASLCKAGLAGKDGRGRYVLGDEFLRMAFVNHELRPDHVRVQPILARLAAHFGETAHYAVLDGPDIVYRAKVDPAVGAFRLTSTVGGRNPAHATAIGKLLLSFALPDFDSVKGWLGDRTLVARTARTAVTPEQLHEHLELIRVRGYGTDDEENESGVNCLAFPIFLSSLTEPSGAVSVSALSYRTKMPDLVRELSFIRRTVAGELDEERQ